MNILKDTYNLSIEQAVSSIEVRDVATYLGALVIHMDPNTPEGTVEDVEAAIRKIREWVSGLNTDRDKIQNSRAAINASYVVLARLAALMPEFSSN